MDKSWIDNDARHTKIYQQGVNNFIAFAFENSAVGIKILCPCRKCVNSFWGEGSEVREHLICDGFLKGYRTWTLHGEVSSSMNHGNYDGVELMEEIDEDDNISDLLRDLAAGLDDKGDFDENNSDLEPCEELVAIQKLVAENSKELYPNCNKYTQLRFLIRLLHTKLLGGWSDKSFNLLLDLLNDALPEGSTLPRNFHEAKKLVKSIGIGYTSIHACDNDCILFWKDNEGLDSCPKCKASRWKSVRKSLDGKHVYKVPKKVLRYFPIKKCLKRIFLSSKTASLVRWHDEDRKKDGLLRHPADSPLWQDFDKKHLDFAADSRNIRLAFATDGFNPFRTMNVSYSVWPGICIPYNFPPSMCMKKSNFILSLLIPGKNAPGSDMDVYYQPLVQDLLDLFTKGVRTYDASKGEFFQLKAAVLWTITDFPGLGYVSGSVTSGEAGCPDCHSYTCSLRLGNGTKTCYMGHRRFLPEDHPFRFDANKFGGKTEFRAAPTPLSGEEVLECTKDLNTVFGKDPSRKKPTTKRRKEGEPLVIFKRRSIWFELPYWKDLMLRHNFDFMHIGKNVSESLVNTFMGIDGKSKDNLNSRLDLQVLGIKSDLHPVEVEDQLYLPPAPYSMSPNEKKLFCKVLNGVKFPHGYASDIRHNVHVNERKIFGLKSHESHIILQHLLPLCVRKILPEIVSAAVIRVCNFFKKLSSPVIRISDMESLEVEIAETLSLLETIFLPSFFDIMVHLMVHLPAQAKIAGPVHFHSMLPVERYLMRLKGSIRTKSHPEGSIMEWSNFTECLTLCSRYLHDGTSHQFRNEDCSTTPFFRRIGRGLAGKCIVSIDHKTWLQAHRYVLFNYDNIQPYLDKHAHYLSSIGIRNGRDISRMHHESFHEWFRLHVEEMGEEAPDEIKFLAKGPTMFAHKYSSYNINGFNFHTLSYDEGRPIQNSGVALVAESSSFESGNNDNIIIGSKTYYGIITEILELNYHHKGNVVLFKCDWVDNRVPNKWVKTDQFGTTTMNFRHLFNTGEKISDEPFILASQAVQVYYVPEAIDTDWVAAVQSIQRDVFDFDNLEDEDINNDNEPVVYLPNLNRDVTVDIVNGVVPSVRTDIDGIIVDRKSLKKVLKKNMSRPKRNNKDVPVNPYEQLRNDQIEINNQKLEALNLPRMNSSRQNVQPSKRTKRTQQSSDAATEGHNQRRSQRNHAENANQQIEEDPEYQPAGDARMEISKANHAKLRIHHTSGSKSFACSRHEMGVELGRVPRRDEIYIRTHTRKNGVPSQQAEPIINKLKSVVEAHPELTERSIQQGDVFAAACGEKEPRGRVRALGLGPTPQDIGTPGLKCYKPTRLQMEVLARKKVESDKASLERRIQELEEELHEARIVQERRKMEIASHNRSNSQNHVNPRSEEHVDEAHHAQPFEDDVFADINENSDHYDEDDVFADITPSEQHANFLSMQRAAVLSARAAALSEQHANFLSVQRAVVLSAQRARALSAQPATTPFTQEAAAAPSVQPAPSPSMQPTPIPSTHRALTSSVHSVRYQSHKNVAPRKKNKPPRVSPADLVGKEVTLYALFRPEAVAKATVISTNPYNVLGGQPLGRHYCEVVVKVVIKRDTVLPRPYDDIETLADAKSMPIQWPYDRLNVSKASHSSKSTAVGEGRHAPKTH